MPNAIELTGQRFGRLMALRRSGTNSHGAALWLWRCDCGNEIERPTYPIRVGRQVSCGCHKVEQSRLRAKHGHWQSRTYRAWIEMKQRVKGKDATCRKHYSNRGIQIDPRWRKSFQAFLSYMGECPTGLSLDRIDNNGHYVPGNCRWTDQKHQLANTRRTVFVNWRGERRCLKHACQEAGVNYDRVRSRIRLGTEPQQAFDKG